MPLFHKNINSIHLAVIILIGLTCLTTAISYSTVIINFFTPLSLTDIDPKLRVFSIIVIVLMTMIKGIKIVDVFMEMRDSPKQWRRFALSYPIIIPPVLASILYL